MAKDTENSKLYDMNGNKLREGDLLLVILKHPILTGYITKVETNLLAKNPLGVITITGTIQIPFDPTKPDILRQAVKIVDPRSEAILQALMQQSKAGAADIKLPDEVEVEVEDKKEPAEPESPAGPVLVKEDAIPSES